MFKRNKELHFTKEEPFKGDLLEREAHIRVLTDLVVNTQGEFVMTLSSPWGTGKTTFLRMWKAHLESLGHPCVLFNAWETDFADEPLLAFIAEISEQLGALRGKEKDADRKAIEQLKNLGKKLLPQMLSLGTRLAFGVAVDFDKLGEKDEQAIASSLGKAMEGYAGEILEKHASTKKLVQDFKGELVNLVDELGKSGSKLPMFFFVDELDRCKPTYAVKLLETVKHLFEAYGIIFVLSLDREQLGHTIKAAYGEGIDADGYLRRFIDIEYRIPEPDVKPFVAHLAKNVYDLSDCPVFREPGEAVGRDRLNSFIDEFSKLSTGVHLRTIEKAFLRGVVLLKGLRNSKVVSEGMLSYFILLRECAPKAFSYFEKKYIISSMHEDCFNDFPKIDYFFDPPVMIEGEVENSVDLLGIYNRLISGKRNQRNCNALEHAFTYYDANSENLRPAIVSRA